MGTSFRQGRATKLTSTTITAVVRRLGRLQDRGLTYEEIMEATGEKKGFVLCMLRLRRLSPLATAALESGVLDQSTAELIVTRRIPEPTRRKLERIVLRDNLSFRDARDLLKELCPPPKKRPRE